MTASTACSIFQAVSRPLTAKLAQADRRLRGPGRLQRRDGRGERLAIAALRESLLDAQADEKHPLRSHVRNVVQQEGRAERAVEVTATDHAVDGMAGCDIELQRRGRELASLVHPHDDAPGAPLLKAAGAHAEVHE